MYININNTQYTLTNEYNKPYLHISNSILPLTTNGGGVIRCKDNNGNTYRPLEYKSISTSDTYYTTAINSEGLSSTTALTRASTSDVSYETRASTSGTNYGTRSSTSGTSYLTSLVSDIHSSYFSYSSWVSSNGYDSYSRTEFNFGSMASTTITTSSTSNRTFSTLQLIVAGRIAYTKYTRTTKSSISAYNVGSSSIFANVYYYHKGGQGSTIATSGMSTITMDLVDNKYYLFTSAASNEQNWGTSIQQFFIDYQSKATTGTIYLTRSSTSGTTYLTRSSTSNTIYLTRSSTSGYSGVSSSSSESSGWE